MVSLIFVNYLSPALIHWWSRHGLSVSTDLGLFILSFMTGYAVTSASASSTATPSDSLSWTSFLMNNSGYIHKFVINLLNPFLMNLLRLWFSQFLMYLFGLMPFNFYHKGWRIEMKLFTSLILNHPLSQLSWFKLHAILNFLSCPFS